MITYYSPSSSVTFTPPCTDGGQAKRFFETSLVIEIYDSNYKLQSIEKEVGQIHKIYIIPLHSDVGREALLKYKIKKYFQKYLPMKFLVKCFGA